MLHFNELHLLNKITENIFASITTWYSFQVYFDKVLYIILYCIILIHTNVQW